MFTYFWSVNKDEFLTMSCIKFPSSKTDLVKPNRENAADYNKVYVELVSAANQAFGERKWSSSITNQSLDYIDYVAGKYSVGCSCVVRIQLPNGHFHENMGYSSTEGSSKGSAIQKARLGSYNSAFKKTLMCFGKDITNKISKTPSRSSSPMLIEVSQSNSLPVPNSCLPIEDKVHVDTQKTCDTFEDCIPMSQAEALMDAAAFDQIVFDKKENSNTLNLGKTEKDVKNSASNAIQTEPQVIVSKPRASAGTANIVNKDSKVIVNSAPKKGIKMEAPKAVASTAMTEEEIRQERKRKQREMQEEFKRKEESKKKMGDNGCKSSPNPRY